MQKNLSGNALFFRHRTPLLHHFHVDEVPVLTAAASPKWELFMHQQLKGGTRVRRPTLSTDLGWTNRTPLLDGQPDSQADKQRVTMVSQTDFFLP